MFLWFVYVSQTALLFLFCDYFPAVHLISSHISSSWFGRWNWILPQAGKSTSTSDSLTIRIFSGFLSIAMAYKMLIIPICEEFGMHLCWALLRLATLSRPGMDVLSSGLKGLKLVTFVVESVGHAVFGGFGSFMFFQLWDRLGFVALLPTMNWDSHWERRFGDCSDATNNKIETNHHE